jgi:hypothetical protein
MSDTYRMKASCTNCSHEWTIEIPLGTKADVFEYSEKCPSCRCEHTTNIKPMPKFYGQPVVPDWGLRDKHLCAERSQYDIEEERGRF